MKPTSGDGAVRGFSMAMIETYATASHLSRRRADAALPRRTAGGLRKVSIGLHETEVDSPSAVVVSSLSSARIMSRLSRRFTAPG
jgi:hypothetical protein